MWPFWVDAVLWSHIGKLMRLLAAEPLSTAGFLFPSQWLCWTILLTIAVLCFTDAVRWNTVSSQCALGYHLCTPRKYTEATSLLAMVWGWRVTRHGVGLAGYLPWCGASGLLTIHGVGWRVLIAEPMSLYPPKQVALFMSSAVFLFSSFFLCYYGACVSSDW